VVPATTIEGEQGLLTHPTLEQLRQLGMAGMARAFEELAANTRGADLDHAEWLGLLLDRELPRSGPAPKQPQADRYGLC
jgi:hypothetical protein